MVTMGRPAGRARSAVLLLLLLLFVSVLSAAAGLGDLTSAPVHAQAVQAKPAIEFDRPTASGDFGETVTFRTSFRSAATPQRVDLLTTLSGDVTQRVSSASLEQTGPDTWHAVVHQGGHVVPNTEYEYRFRVVTEDGTALGPQASHRVSDTHLEWQQLSGEDVTVWWHQGDAAFAERALGIAEASLASAAELLGVEDVSPVDFFIYSDSQAFRQALGPATRENVGGEAHPYIRTLFGLIEPRQVSSDWVEELVGHELTHLVFDEAVDNPYGYPPRWLNEGLAVYLATGYDSGDRAQVEAAARAGSLIPLEGLAGQFPTRATRFGLAYAESISAVDHFVETHGQAKLVELVRSFADGMTLEEAFVAATGQGFTAFEDAWLAAIGGQRPEPYGPRPQEPGPTPGARASTGLALLR